MTLTDAIAKLRKLNEDVPQPLRLPTKDEVTTAEEQLGVRFHPNYRRYLLEASDVVYDGVEPAQITDRESHTSLFEVVGGAREMELPEKLLPICEDNGSYFCMNAGGEVVYWDHNGTTDEKWPDLATWIAEVWIGEADEDAADGDDDDEADDAEDDEDSDDT
jgi:hypothetical protein